MPRKGLPYCKSCQVRNWRVESSTESSSLLVCLSCGNKQRTQSRRRWATEREQREEQHRGTISERLIADGWRYYSTKWYGCIKRVWWKKGNEICEQGPAYRRLKERTEQPQ